MALFHSLDAPWGVPPILLSQLPTLVQSASFLWTGSSEMARRR